MDASFSRIDLPTQSLYSEFLDRLSIREAQRAIGHTGGTFVRKRVHGNTYVYFQSVLPGGDLRQIYLGKKSPKLDRLAAQFAQPSFSLTRSKKLRRGEVTSWSSTGAGRTMMDSWRSMTPPRWPSSV